jgi:mannose-1-phosphate guanylyltransferase
MKAIILAAGFGTRLQPLTDKKPKALMPIVNRPIIARNIEYLKTHGVDKIAVNAHHHYQQILDYLDKGRPFGIEIEVLVEPEILGTGGGIRNGLKVCEGGPFFVINSDTLTNIDLTMAYEDHKKSGSIASLILHNYELYNQVLIDDNRQIIDIGKKNYFDRLAFSGIHIIETDVLHFIPESGYSDIIDCYRNMILKKSINAFISKGHYWHDIGTLNGYIEANREILNLEEEPFSTGHGSQIDPSARLKGWAVIGDRSILGKGVEVERSIIWEDVRVRENISIVDSVVTSFREIEDNLSGAIY